MAEGVWRSAGRPGERLKELEQENAKLKRLVANLSLDKPCVEGLRLGKLLSPERRRIAADHAQQKHGLTERRACRLANQPRGTQWSARPFMYQF